MSSMRDEAIQLCEEGYYINTKRPPDVKKYGRRWSGYPDWNRMVLFHDFCVGAREMEVTYKGGLYLFEEDTTGVHQCKEAFGNPCGQNYRCGNDFLDQFRFPDGKRILDVIDELEIEMW